MPKLPDLFEEQTVIQQSKNITVCKAKLRGTDRRVSVKVIPYYTTGSTGMKIRRELVMIRHFQCCNQVVPWLGCFKLDSAECNVPSLCIVTEYVPSNLKTLALTTEGQAQLAENKEEKIKLIVCKLLLGVRALHVRGCMHRDLTTEMLLIDNELNLFIGDLGLAKAFDESALNSVEVPFDIFYQAPETICCFAHSTSYDPKIDLWSVGVIIGELWQGTHLFRGTTDEFSLLTKIVTLVGPPPATIFEAGGSFMGADEKFQKVCEMAQAESVDAKFAKVDVPAPCRTLLAGLLQFDPKARPTADEALNSPWFDTVREFIASETAAMDRSWWKAFWDQAESADATVPEWSPTQEQAMLASAA